MKANPNAKNLALYALTIAMMAGWIAGGRKGPPPCPTERDLFRLMTGAKTGGKSTQ